MTEGTRWGDALDAHRAQRFVGRRDELDLFAALLEGRRGGHFLYVQGAAGVGKSQLLHAFKRLAEARGRTVEWLEATCLIPDAVQVEQALGRASAALGGEGVLLIDGWDRLAALDSWLREEALPRLDVRTRVVAAGRQPLSEAWHRDPGWSAEIHVLELAPLGRLEASPRGSRRDAEVAPVVASQMAVHASGSVDAWPAPLARRSGTPGGSSGCMGCDVTPASRCQCVRRSWPLERTETRCLAQGPEHGRAMPLGYGQPTVEGRAAVAGRLAALVSALSELASWSVLQARDRDWDAIAAGLARHEGTEAVALARFWWERDGEWLILGREGERCAGFLHLLDLDRVSPADAAWDPGTAAAREHVLRRGELVPGRPAWLVRFWMASATYQSVSSAQTALLLHLSDRLQAASFAPTRALMCVRDTRAWGFCGQLTHRKLGAGFESDGAEYGILALDLDRESTSLWHRAFFCQYLARHESGAETRAIQHAGGRLRVGKPPLDAGGHPETWVRGVKAALKVVCQPDLLSKSPLVELALVRERCPDLSERRRARALAQLLRDEAARFRELARDEHYADVLERAYFRPVTKLVVAADELGMGYSTFRRHLGVAVRRLAANLRARERELAETGTA
jgi:hypothetical protein